MKSPGQDNATDDYDTAVRLAGERKTALDTARLAVRQATQTSRDLAYVAQRALIDMAVNEAARASG